MGSARDVPELVACPPSEGVAKLNVEFRKGGPVKVDETQDEEKPTPDRKDADAVSAGFCSSCEFSACATAAYAFAP